MKYDEAKTKTFGSGQIPDGYFGDKIEVEFFLHDNKIMILTPQGYFSSHLPNCLTVEEAIWVILNHPKGKKYVKNFKVK